MRSPTGRRYRQILVDKYASKSVEGEQNEIVELQKIIHKVFELILPFKKSGMSPAKNRQV